MIAPFDALVVSKDIQIGTNIQVGVNLAQLYDISLFEISLPLTSQQWELLPNIKQNEKLSKMAIQLIDEGSLNKWIASIERFEQHINGSSRQRSLIAVVEQPIEQEVPLFPGLFVKAHIKGNAYSALWKLPASALIDNNTVWQVNNDDLLKRMPVSIVFSQDNFVFVKPINNIAMPRIVNRPLSSYLVNMKVSPKVEELM